MARLLVAALVAACYIACASAQPAPGSDYYPDGPCVCNGNYGQKPYKHTTTGQVQYWPCEPYECEPVLSAGEIAGIAVGCVVFLILIIIIIVWCVYCGCDCDCDDRPLHRYPSVDEVYVRQAVPAVKPQFVQTTVVPQVQPTIQVIKAPNFQQAVPPQVVQIPSTVVQKSVVATPQITYLS